MANVSRKLVIRRPLGARLPRLFVARVSFPCMGVDTYTVGVTWAPFRRKLGLLGRCRCVSLV